MSEDGWTLWTDWMEDGSAVAYWMLDDADGIPPAAIRQVGPRWYRWGAVGGGRGHRRSLAAAKRACESWLAGARE